MESCRHVINDAAVRGYQNLMTAVKSSTELSARLLGSGITKRVGHSTRSSSMAAILSLFFLSVGASVLRMDGLKPTGYYTQTLVELTYDFKYLCAFLATKALTKDTLQCCRILI